MKKRAKKKNAGAARRDYIAKHWGERGRFAAKVLDVTDPKSGDLVVLGALEKIAYVTKKRGDKVLTEYEHDFDPKDPPLLCYVRGQKKRGLVIAGGSYRMTDRGIVG